MTSWPLFVLFFAWQSTFALKFQTVVVELRLPDYMERRALLAVTQEDTLSSLLLKALRCHSMPSTPARFRLLDSHYKAVESVAQLLKPSPQRWQAPQIYLTMAKGGIAEQECRGCERSELRRLFPTPLLHYDFGTRGMAMQLYNEVLLAVKGAAAVGQPDGVPVNVEKKGSELLAELRAQLYTAAIQYLQQMAPQHGAGIIEIEVIRTRLTVTTEAAGRIRIPRTARAASGSEMLLAGLYFMAGCNNSIANITASGACPASRVCFPDPRLAQRGSWPAAQLVCREGIPSRIVIWPAWARHHIEERNGAALLHFSIRARFPGLAQPSVGSRIWFRFRRYFVRGEPLQITVNDGGFSVMDMKDILASHTS